MSKSTHNRQREYQRKVLTERNLDYMLYENHGSTSWWRNPMNSSSLRMTYPGYKFFSKILGIKTYPIELSEPLKSKHLLQLERLFSEPYYINQESIIVFGEGDAIMLQLHAGNLPQYLENLQVNNT